MDGIELPESVKRIARTSIVYATFVGFYLLNLLCDFVKHVKFHSLKFYEAHLKKCDFSYRGVRVTTDRPSIRPYFEIICKAPKFLNWLDKFPLDKFDLRSINLTDVDFFGKITNPEKLGFLKFKCDVFTKLGEQLDGIVFLRGETGAVLIIVKDEKGDEFVLLTEQPRIPTGCFKEEIISGMFDADTSSAVFSDVLRREINEETGMILDFSEDNYIRLGEYALSSGGSDEIVHLAVWKTEVESHTIEEMKNRQYGEKGSNEKIRLKFYPVDIFEKELIRIADAKTSLVWFLYKGI
jgi:ADP-sugar diphosphatase